MKVDLPKDVEQALDNIVTAREAVLTHIGGKVRRVSGAFPCPICKTGSLHYIVQANGHVWGSCTNKPKCVSWVE